MAKETQVAPRPVTDEDMQQIEQVMVGGDMSALTASQRVMYYRRVCESLKLNPLTKPFQYIVLSGKLVLYASRDCADQLRKLNGISIEITGREKVEDLYCVTAKAKTQDGRSDESMGVVSLAGKDGKPLRGDLLANAFMKAETKAKRRVTLSLAGLGWMDETELETVSDYEKVEVDDDGEIQQIEQKSTPPSDEKRQRDNEKYKGFLTFCGERKATFGEKAYYAVLKTFELSHANQVKVGDYSTMRKIVEALNEQPDLPEEEEEAVEAHAPLTREEATTDAALMDSGELIAGCEHYEEKIKLDDDDRTAARKQYLGTTEIDNADIEEIRTYYVELALKVDGTDANLSLFS